MSEQVSDGVAAEVLAKCGRFCCLCRRFRPTMLQVHHIVEQSKGGTSDLDNLIAICLTCHSDVHTHRPFTRRFTVDELQQHRNAVYALVAGGELVRPDDDYDRLTTRWEGVELVGPASGRTLDTMVIARGQVIEPALPPEAVDILIAATESEYGQVIMARSSGGLAVQVGQRNFVPSRLPRDEARYKHAVEQLVENGLLDGYDKVFTVTHNGFLLADQLLALRAKNAD